MLHRIHTSDISITAVIFCLRLWSPTQIFIHCVAVLVAKCLEISDLTSVSLDTLCCQEQCTRIVPHYLLRWDCGLPCVLHIYTIRFLFALYIGSIFLKQDQEKRNNEQWAVLSLKANSSRQFFFFNLYFDFLQEASSPLCFGWELRRGCIQEASAGSVQWASDSPCKGMPCIFYHLYQQARKPLLVYVEST